MGHFCAILVVWWKAVGAGNRSGVQGERWHDSNVSQVTGALIEQREGRPKKKYGRRRENKVKGLKGGKMKDERG